MERPTKTFCPDRVLSYFRVEWLPLTLVTVSGLVYNIGLLATPWFEGRLAQCLADILGGSETAARMALLVLAYILTILVVQAARFIKRFYVRRFANNINRRMKGILYANLVRQSRTALEQEGAGELMTKAISDVDDCVEGMRKFSPPRSLIPVWRWQAMWSCCWCTTGGWPCSVCCSRRFPMCARHG